MSAINTARDAMRVHGPAFDRFRGVVPLALLIHWIAKETTTRGKPFDRLAVSIDPRLIEVGWSQCPISRALSLDTDPFEVYGASWLAGYEANEDARYWQSADSDDPQRRRVAEWLPPRGSFDRNLAWVVECDYSIGTGALRRVLYQATLRARTQGRTVADRGLMAEAIEWAERTDLGAPQYRGYWGRQTPQQILDRLRKHRDWITDAEQVGPLDTPPGGEPPAVRPSYAAPFPKDLVRPALVVNKRSSTTDECKAAWREVRAYAAARRRREFLPRKGIKATTLEWLAESRPEPLRIVVEREDGPRAVVSW